MVVMVAVGVVTSEEWQAGWVSGKRFQRLWVRAQGLVVGRGFVSGDES